MILSIDINLRLQFSFTYQSEVMSSRTHFEVLGFGLEGSVIGFGLEASSFRKLPCSRTALFFELFKFCRSPKKILLTFSFFWRSPEKFFDLFVFESSACVLRPCPWPRAFQPLTSNFFVSLALSSTASSDINICLLLCSSKIT